jgi:hypothetical protein
VTKRQMRRPLVSAFGEAVCSSEVIRRYFCSYKNDNPSLRRLELLEGERERDMIVIYDN